MVASLSRMKLHRNWRIGTTLLFLQWLHTTEAQPRPAAPPPMLSSLDIRHEHIAPDFHRCHRAYGTGLSLDSCLRALSQIPTQGDHEGYMDFFHDVHNYHPRQHRPKYQLPLHFVDPHFASSAPHALPCSIILQAEPWPAGDFDFETFSAIELRHMVEEVLRDCVGHHRTGGFITYGLFETSLYFFENFAREAPAPFVTITVTNLPHRPEPGTNDPALPNVLRQELYGYYGTRYDDNTYIVDDVCVRHAQLRLAQIATTMRVGRPNSWLSGVYPLPATVVVSGHM